MARRSRTAKSQQSATTQATQTIKANNKQARATAPTGESALSRRKLMAGSAIGMATLGIAASSMGNLTSLRLFGASAARSAPAALKGAAPRTALKAPMMLYILDATGDEVRLLYGEHEVVIHDSALVARLANVVQ